MSAISGSTFSLVLYIIAFIFSVYFCFVSPLSEIARYSRESHHCLEVLRSYFQRLEAKEEKAEKEAKKEPSDKLYKEHDV